MLLFPKTFMTQAIRQMPSCQSNLGLAKCYIWENTKVSTKIIKGWWYTYFIWNYLKQKSTSVTESPWKPSSKENHRGLKQGEKLKKIKVQIEIAPQALGVKTLADHVTPDIYLIRYLTYKCHVSFHIFGKWGVRLYCIYGDYINWPKDSWLPARKCCHQRDPRLVPRAHIGLRYSASYPQWNKGDFTSLNPSALDTFLLPLYGHFRNWFILYYWSTVPRSGPGHAQCSTVYHSCEKWGQDD